MMKKKVDLDYEKDQGKWILSEVGAKDNGCQRDVREFKQEGVQEKRVAGIEDRREAKYGKFMKINSPFQREMLNMVLVMSNVHFFILPNSSLGSLK